MKLFAGILALLFVSTGAQAFQMGMSAGAMHLPDSSYHYLGYGLDLRFGSGDVRFFTDFGASHPYRAHGYHQNIAFFSAGAEFLDRDKSGLAPFGGIGLGAYADHVGSNTGILPALVVKGGARLGAPALGLKFELESYVGIFEPGHLASWVMWPLINWMVGVYVGL